MADYWEDVLSEQNAEAVSEVTAGEMASECGMELISGDEDTRIALHTLHINRPGLFLAGFNNYFANKRLQVIGNAEAYYLETLSYAERYDRLNDFFSSKIPCVIYSRGIKPNDIGINLSKLYNIPIFSTKKATSELVNNMSAFLNRRLAPLRTMHGVLLEVSGNGVLLTGHSGMGKSETALELIHRGHKLVADDNVIIQAVQNELIGCAPERIKHFMEIRGIGIIDVRSMFGVSSVLTEKKIDMIIEFENWQSNVQYDRLGGKENYENILGVNVPKYVVPVMPGRNLAIIVEVASRDLRLKQMGYNALEQLLANAKLD